MFHTERRAQDGVGGEESFQPLALGELDAAQAGAGFTKGEGNIKLCQIQHACVFVAPPHRPIASRGQANWAEVLVNAPDFGWKAKHLRSWWARR